MLGELAPVEVNLGARTAGAGVAHRPEVFLLVEAVELRLGKPDLVSPDVVGLVVLLEDRDDKVVRLEPNASVSSSQAYSMASSLK